MLLRRTFSKKQTWGIIIPPFVIVGQFRYINAKIMSAEHDWAEENADLRGLKSLIEIDAFHNVLDRGMAI